MMGTCAGRMATTLVVKRSRYVSTLNDVKVKVVDESVRLPPRLFYFPTARIFLEDSFALLDDVIPTGLLNLAT